MKQLTTDMELLRDTVIEVQELLKDNTEWIDRYDGYADLLIKNQDNLQKLARQFNRFEPLQFYIQVSKAKASDTNLFLDVRYMGQNVALLSSNKNGVFITTDSSKDKLIKTNERDFGFQDKLKKGTLWRSEEAARFRKFFKERPYVRNHEKGSKGNEEHNIESLLIGEFEKRNSGEKQLLFIQPIKYASHKLRFAMPTPITASNYHAVKYSKHRGGGIDILARTGSSHSRLCVIEVKDENLKEEPPTHALRQSIKYAVFLRELLRSKSGEKWWKILGYSRSLSKQLVINAAIAMPFAEDRFVTDFAGKQISIGNDIAECHYIYFSKNSDRRLKIEESSLGLNSKA